MTENSNVNAAILQALQRMTVVAAVDRPTVLQNGQNSEITTIHNILHNFSTVNIVKVQIVRVGPVTLECLVLLVWHYCIVPAVLSRIAA